MLSLPHASVRNILQFGHCASQGRQSAAAFAFDKNLQSFSNQRRFLLHPGKLLGDVYEIVNQD
jgi:hypothetical protein